MSNTKIVKNLKGYNGLIFHSINKYGLEVWKLAKPIGKIEYIAVLPTK